MSEATQPRSDAPAVAEVRGLALSLLGGTGGSVTQDRIRQAVETALQALATMNRPIEIDAERLIREIESLVNVFVGHSTSLDDAEGHVPWLADRRGSISWDFWDRYRRYLREIKAFPPGGVQRLDEITDDILGRLEDPERQGPWDRRGMVVGQVQSGKTANYTGLICKAADAGYRLIVVLAGVHNSLRSQTQLRLDEGFLGFDTQQKRFFDQANRRMGVGRLAGSERLLAVSSLTNSEEKGDFNLKVARQVAMGLGQIPVLLVVKKNASILRNLITWATELNQHPHPETGRMVVPGIPLLVIDDEADHASVNTKEMVFDENGKPDDETDPTKINALIRTLLYTFEQSAYVGYTATPFANIFAYAGDPSERFGDDLFPRSFIVRLPPPSDHVGPAEVFGVSADKWVGLEARGGLPIIRAVEDSDSWLLPSHKKDAVPGPLPASLRRAMRSFVLTCAARAARGQEGVHNTMLVHVTRFVDVQERVADQISQELAAMRDRLRYGEGDAAKQLIDELRQDWEIDFSETSASFDEAPRMSWEQLEPHVAPAISRIAPVMRINGSARDALTYYDHPNGISVIAVGGDKLSRGLTLEGLSVSYFLRSSRMYDTLMQMGRWFGYRPGYLDLCRLYTTTELREWYRAITTANEELLLLFDDMAEVGGTPENFGLRVRKHPDGLMITARAKMRHGKDMKLSFENSSSETVAFHTDLDVQARNFGLTERFLRRQSGAGRGPEPTAGPSPTVLWRGVPAEHVADLLAHFTTHEEARKAQGAYLARYIRACASGGELTRWTVALAGRSGIATERAIAGITLGLIQRGASESSDSNVYRIRRIASPTDEYLDLPTEAVLQARKLTQRIRKESELPDVPSGPAIRRHRPKTDGLLVLYPLDAHVPEIEGRKLFPPAAPPVMGFLVSFPASETAPTVDYVVDNTYWQLEMGLA
jgi:hypothetical protein